MTPPFFDHEKPEVYQESLLFWGWVGALLASVGAKAAAKDQLDRASTSVPLNIAEGKERLVHILRMLMGLLRRFSPHAGMIREDEADYEQEQE